VKKLPVLGRIGTRDRDALSCLIAHLHPSSGVPVPSPDDVMMTTTRLKEAGELLGIPVVDQIVLGRGCYISMAERGLV
jgi:DNA repair protein RadC